MTLKISFVLFLLGNLYSCVTPKNERDFDITVSDNQVKDSVYIENIQKYYLVDEEIVFNVRLNKVPDCASDFNWRLAYGQVLESKDSVSWNTQPVLVKDSIAKVKIIPKNEGLFYFIFSLACANSELEYTYLHTLDVAFNAVNTKEEMDSLIHINGNSPVVFIDE